MVLMVVVTIVAFMVVLVEVDVVMKCDHYGGTNPIEPYCWVKYDKPDYVHQVTNATTAFCYIWTCSS